MAKAVPATTARSMTDRQTSGTGSDESVGPENPQDRQTDKPAG